MNQENALHRVYQKYQFYISPEHPCSYLEPETARTVFIDPNADMNMDDYGHLLAAGFRRSGSHVYRPACEQCQLCIPLRIPVKEFKPRRNQRRNWQANADLDVTIIPSQFHEAHYQLYQSYMRYRHPGGGMDDDDPEAYQRVIGADWSDSLLFEFRDKEKLVAVAVVDRLKNAYSAVYTFFHPAYDRRSLGRFAILYQLEQARIDQKDWLYLGYWNPECQKMSYKNQYQPCEIYRDMHWHLL